MRWRHYSLVVLMLLAAGVLVARMAYLNVTQSAFLQREGDARSVRLETLPAYRGIIFDRRGEPLAVSTPVVSVWIDPSRARLAPAELAQLAQLLELSAPELAARLERFASREFLYLRRRITPELAAQVAALDLVGVHFEREYKRYYPAGASAAHLVGITNVDDVGQEGVELAFDQHLRGRQGSKRVLKDNRRRTIRNLEYLAAPQFGQDLHLSIDLRLQYYAHQELQRALVETGAKSASLVMLDARTGEILALTNAPSYNPNQVASATADAMRNRAATDLYEPGSTVKPFTVLAALESGQYEPRTQVNTAPGFMRVGTSLIQDPINRGTLTLTEILARSSQVGVARIALSLDQEAVFGALVRAGFGQHTGVGLPGEAAGRLSSEQLRTPIVRATLAYGYGMTATPLQLARSYLVLANEGRSLPVSMLRLDAGVSPFAPEQLFDPLHVRQVVTMMEAVVTPQGTAPRARVVGYEVAGKTGTARKVGTAGYDDSRHLAFFAGMAPVENPRIVVVVVINEPQGERTGGGEVASPVFSRVVGRALRVLGVEPSEAQWQTRA